MKKKIVFIVGILLFLSLLWYLFLKPYDYLVGFKAKTFPAAVGQSIKTWGKSLQSTVTVEKNGINQLMQEFQFNDSIHTYVWKIFPITDSTSKVNVYVTDVKNSLLNRLTIPFSQTAFERRTERTVFDFVNKLKDYTNHFRVITVGEDHLTQTYCACVALNGPQSEKALNMMKNYTLLNDFIIEGKLELNGKPFVEVTHWDKENEFISYNFCYPILPTDSIPENPIIKYKDRKGGKAIKAIYNGNYISSDLAWYKLLDFANAHDIDVDERPVEIFYNNPNVGGEELNWITEIYMPLKQ